MKISSVFATTNAVYMVIAGDFNCSDGSRFDDISVSYTHLTLPTKRIV